MSDGTDTKVAPDSPGEPDTLFWSKIGPNKDLPATPGRQDDFFVGYTENDGYNPMEWPALKKSINMFAVGVCVLTVSWGSASIGPGVTGIDAEFHVSSVVGALLVSLYVAGFAVGPVVWGPMSEMYGRKIPLIFGMFVFLCFTFAAATAKDFQTLALSRFFMGTFGASPIVVGVAVAADTFSAKTRGVVVSILSAAINAGPMVSPVVSGYISASYLGWRWTMYITGILGSLCFVLLVFVSSESYGPYVLTFKAKKIREDTGNWAVSAPLENIELDTKDLLKRTVAKPLYMLLVEPMLLYISLYNGFIYGILYLCLEAVPLIFASPPPAGYGWPGGNSYLPYLALFVGVLCTVAMNVLYFEPTSYKRLKESGRIVLPEERFRPMMLAGIFFPIGIFLFTWSAAYQVHWIVPMVGAAFIGYGLIGIFLACLNAIIDIYLLHAASAIAANTFLRSGMGAAFPLFASIMFKNLGTQWAGTLLGCLAVVFLPAPFIFFFFGPKIRQKSKYALKEPKAYEEDKMERMSSQAGSTPEEAEQDQIIRQVSKHVEQ